MFKRLFILVALSCVCLSMSAQRKNVKSRRISDWISEGKYTGELLNNKPNGYGEMLYDDGTSYTGYWVDGYYEGQGTYVFNYDPSKKDGLKYIGEYKRGYLNGQGKCYFGFGGHIEGRYKDGDLHGVATFYDDNGKQTKTAYYVNGIEKEMPKHQSSNTASSQSSKNSRNEDEAIFGMALGLAKEGNSYAMYVLGCYYLEGKYTEQNYEEAISWLLKAGKEGSHEAYYKLAECYEKGIGVSKNLNLSNQYKKKGDELSKGLNEELEKMLPVINWLFNN